MGRWMDGCDVIVNYGVHMCIVCCIVNVDAFVLMFRFYDPRHISMSHVSCLTSHVSCLMSHVSCVMC